MKKLSLQWRITLMTVLLIGITCVSMELLLCTSGIHYMDSIGESLQDLTLGGETDFFDPETVDQDQDLTIIIYGAQENFCITNWYITAIVIVLSGILAYFVSGHALKPLRSFSAQVEKVQINNLTDMKMNENLLPEFYRLSHSFNQMLDRLNQAFAVFRRASRYQCGNSRISPAFGRTDGTSDPDVKDTSGNEQSSTGGT